MKKILVIEDNLSIRASTLEILQEEGFQAIVAENGKQGIQMAQAYQPDMILCDVMMPEMDGYGVLERLRRDPQTATIPFIFLSACAAKADMRQGMELGADDYLTKPYSREELVGAIASRLAKQAILQSQSEQQLKELRNSIALSLPHELRTPLHGILGLAEVLMDDYARIPRTEIFEIAQGIHQSAERLYRLIQNFLLYAELEMTLQDPQRLAAYHTSETHYPQVLIATSATKIATRSERSSDLRLDLKNLPVRFSDTHLKKVIEELVDNAFKFSQPGTLVTLSSNITDTTLQIKIIDQGRGMTAQQIAQLGAYMQFDRHFYEQQGSGLGLAIAKRLVELHGGRLEITSTPEQQTTVLVELQRIIEST
jgi:signal transduction histidine kinase